MFTHLCVPKVLFDFILGYHLSYLMDEDKPSKLTNHSRVMGVINKVFKPNLVNSFYAQVHVSPVFRC